MKRGIFSFEIGQKNPLVSDNVLRKTINYFSPLFNFFLIFANRTFAALCLSFVHVLYRSVIVHHKKLDWLMLPGAECPDGSSIVSLVPGSKWINTNGVWTLVGCPAGYTLNSEQCEVCPGGYYCTGGSIPATPCSSGLYTLPGATDAVACKPAVFVIVTISVPIMRYTFSDAVELLFLNGLASTCGLNPGYMVISGIVGDFTTSVSCTIATENAKFAAVLAQTLNGDVVQNGLSLYGFPNCAVLSVQVTGCLPGFVLSTSQTCQLCPSGFFCVGGSSPAVPCSAGFFAFPGANSSVFCKPAVFVILVISLPMSIGNFTDLEMTRFQTAVATATDVSLESVLVVKADELSMRADNTLRRTSYSSIQVTAEIAVADTSAALSVAGKINPSILNKCLVSQGLPEGSLQSVTTSVSNLSFSQGAPIALIVGAFVGSFVLLLSCFAVFLFSKVEAEDERELRYTMEQLRTKLHITAQDGYLVGYRKRFVVCRMRTFRSIIYLQID